MGGRGPFGRLMTLAGFREQTRPYVCVSCGASYDVQYHVCPECGGYSVEHSQV